LDDISPIPEAKGWIIILFASAIFVNCNLKCSGSKESGQVQKIAKGRF